jgi:hypothetical protein
MSFVTGTTLPMVRYFIQDEFDNNHQEQGSIMRENCIASKIMKSYIRRIGQSYLEETLGDIVYQLVINERKLSLEINPSFTEPDELERNKLSLIKKVTLIIDKITSKQFIDKMPLGIRVVSGYIAELSKQYAPNRIHALVGGFLMLRYFNPAIFTPETSGLLPKGKVPSTITRRNLTLITKILQNLASGVEFGKKEQFMTCLNSFIEEKQKSMNKYFDNVILPANTTVPSIYFILLIFIYIFI